MATPSREQLQIQLRQHLDKIRTRAGECLDLLPNGNRIRIDECLADIENASKYAMALNYRIAQGGKW